MTAIYQLLQAQEGLLPHGFCYLRKPDLIWLHVISDGVIAAAYFMIPLVLVYFLGRIRTRISFDWAIGLFAAFIVLCGTGHILDIVTVWVPAYYLQGGVRALTAAVSIATALMIIPLVPKLLSMKTPQELEEANQKLLAEVQAREAAEEELRKSLADLSSAVRELEQFAYITSHDLQAPLRNIAGFSQLLTRRYQTKLDGDALEFLNFIDQGVRQMQMLIRDLLQLSRVGRTEGKPESRPLDESIRSALAAVQPEIEKTGAKVEIVGPMPEVPAVQTLMVQLFQNLIGNAVKFQKPGATPAVKISAEKEGRNWHIRVSDNGIGIPGDQLENVFAVFRRLHSAEEYEGTGIGLAICRKIVQHHRGEIWAESDGTGSTFHVRLPVELPTSPLDRAAVPRAIPDLAPA
ncbi:MAG TPA: ATP-binding protein [Nevskiaceae bacterium]|nr:ATP-binding protein [Nevskiaceae bacterium]